MRLGIDVAIDYDQTIVLYQRRPWRRIGWLNHRLTSGEYSMFSAFEVGEKDGAGRRLIASGGYPIIRRYQGPFDVKFRFDVLEGASLKTILNREESAEFDWEQKTVADQFVSASIEDDLVTFQYLRILHDESRAAAVYRYSVSAETRSRVSRRYPLRAVPSSTNGSAWKIPQHGARPKPWKSIGRSMSF